MAVAYWIVAGVLAVFYLYSGGIKVASSRDRLRPMMRWVDSVPMALVRTIGGLELLGAVGLIVPPAVGIAVGLAMASAIGLVLLQIAATTLHVRRGEVRQIGLNVGLLILAGVAIALARVWL